MVDGYLTRLGLKLEALGRRSLFLQVDATHSDQVDLFVRQVIDELGKVDILVNNVGIPSQGRALEDENDTFWRHIVEANLSSGIFTVSQNSLYDRKRGGTVKAATRERHPELLPILDCPRWDRCSAPICPLDRRMAQRVAVDGSATGGIKETTCALPKSKRMELGKDLPWLGLWPRELAGTRQWADAASEERSEKARQLALGRDRAAITNDLRTEVALQVL